MPRHLRALPGLAAPWTRIELQTDDEGYHTLTIVRADGPGFATLAGRDTYERLTFEECLDVLSAELDL